ncbi:baseplate J/gp47 family protein [Haliangium sp.]|uniref:baseplate J/gp47 family protein n=1 Tax=Haliangium sp. TaxID=2663208 RepID=UPI003D0EA67A
METGLYSPASLAKRRLAVRQLPDLSGIDFIDVDNGPSGPGDYELQVHFLGPGIDLASLSPADLRFEPDLGGATIEVAVSGDTLAVTAKNVRDVDRGYVLRLAPTVAGMDRFFDHVAFRFDIDAQVGFERPASEPVAAQEPVPPIDYLVRDYRGFRRLMLDRIATLVPDRDRHHPADLMTALVEAIAYRADQLSYFQDAVATEAYLGTARRRVSVRRHARLLGYRVREGMNARTWVAFELAPDSGEVELPGKTPVLTRVRPDRVGLSPSEYERALSVQAPEVFETMHPASLRSAHNRLPLYPWGSPDFVLPAGATSAHLAGAYGPDSAAPLAPGDVLILEQAGSDTGSDSTRDARATSGYRAHAVRLTTVEADVDPLGSDLEAAADGRPTATPLTRIAWHRDDALPWDLVITTESLTRAHAVGNVVLADHGRTIADEPLPAPAARPRDGRPSRYRPRLTRIGLTHAAPYDHASARAQLVPASRTLDTDPGQAMPAIALANASGQIWSPSHDLLEAGGDAPTFVVEHESDRTAWLRFGDGVYGRSAPATSLMATYRVGNGLRGNLGAHALAHVVVADAAIQRAVATVRNPLPASGGVEPEPLDLVRIRAPRAHWARSRAATPQDYADLARAFPGVRTAVALASAGRPTPINIRVERDHRQPLDERFVRDLLVHIEPARTLGHKVVVWPASYLGVDLAIEVTVAPGHAPAGVIAAVVDAFSARDFGDDLGDDLGPDVGDGRGYFHPERFDFGQSVTDGDIAKHALATPGVADVEVTLTPARMPWLPPSDGAITPQRDQIVRLDNDPLTPEYGTLRVTERSAS